MNKAVGTLRWSLIARSLFWLALALFGWTAARFTVAVLLPARTLPVVQAVPEAPSVQSLDMVQQILAAGLFGDIPQAIEKKVVRAKPSATISGLVLHGVVATGDDAALAMIASEQSGGVAKIYALNEELPGGGVLYDVLSDRVLVDIGPTRLQLHLRKLDKGKNAPGSAPAQAAAKVERPTTPSPRISLAALQNDLKDNPGALSRRFVARPFRQGGVQIGYSVREIGQQAVMKKLGLRSGDIVTQVNGIDLNSDAQALAVYQELTQAKSVVAKVMRGNRTIEIKKTIE